MQLKKIERLRPLTILAATTLATGGSHVYADMNQYSNIASLVSNSFTSKYLDEIEDDFYTDLSIRNRFETYLVNWEKETFFLSSAERIINNENFKGIISLGSKVIPFIIDEIEQRPSTLVWALNFIYGEKISNSSTTTITEACKSWIKKLRN